MIRIRFRAHAARASSVHRAPVRAVRGKDPRHRAVVGPAAGAPVFTVEGRYQRARLDRVDAGLPVRLGAPAVRRDRRRGVPRARPRAHGRADGAAPHARRRPRPRLQQRQHLRQPAAADARGPHRRERVGSCASTSWRSRLSGAVQARALDARCRTAGYIYSFNGPHSLFVDTIRSLRALALAHRSATR